MFSVRGRSYERRVLVLLGAAAPLGCALIVGDPVGDLSVDAAAHALDASRSLDAPVHKDGTTPARDGGVDARRDVQLDVDARDGGRGDVGHDASEADADHRDARLEDSALDAGHDAIGDVGVDSGGFCKSLSVPTGVWFTCDDFDEVADTGAFGPTNGYGPGIELAATMDASLSPPRSVFVTIDPTNAATAGMTMRHTIPTANRYTLDFDVKVGPLPTVGSSQLGGLGFGTGIDSIIHSGLTFTLNPNASGALGSLLIQEMNTATDGAVNYVNHLTYAFPAPVVGSWIHISLQLAGGAPQPIDSLSVNDATVEANYALGPGFFSGIGEATLGWSYAASAGVRTAHIDNVVITAQ